MTNYLLISLCHFETRKSCQVTSLAGGTNSMLGFAAVLSFKISEIDQRQQTDVRV